MSDDFFTQMDSPAAAHVDAFEGAPADAATDDFFGSAAPVSPAVADSPVSSPVAASPVSAADDGFSGFDSFAPAQPDEAAPAADVAQPAADVAAPAALAQDEDLAPPAAVPSFLDGADVAAADVAAPAALDFAEHAAFEEAEPEPAFERSPSVEDVAAAQPESQPEPVVDANDFRVVDEGSKFEEQHAKLLAEKTAAEQERYQAMVARAREDLDSFYAERQQRTEAARNENRNSKAAMSIMDEVPDDDKAAWVNVGRLVDTQAVKKEGCDTSRMKEILVAMRH